MSPLARQLRWLIGIRLVVITSVVLPYFLMQLVAARRAPVLSAEPQALIPESDFLYLLAGLTYLASLLYIVLLGWLREYLTLNAYLQFFGDLLLVTGLVYYFGGIASPFSMLYLIVIAVASTLLRRRAGFTVATAAYVLYATLLLTLFFHKIPTAQGIFEESVSIWRLTYNLAVHLFGFYAVAVLTSYLAQNIARAEKELEEKREDLADLQMIHRDVIQSINSGLITTDLEGRITGINRAGQQILGKGEEELVGHHIAESTLFTAEQWQSLSVARSGKGRLRSDVTLLRKGMSIYIGFSISPLTDAEGAHRGHIITFQDLTQWRKLEEEVRIKDRMAAVGELAAGIAHEIGNPLAAISGSVQILAKSPPERPEHRKLLDILLKESQRLDRTIKGFLQFARPKERSAVRFDVARLLTENFELLRNSQEVSPHHRLELDLDPPVAPIVADPDQVSQIFWNLARNALRAMPDGGVLRVTGRYRDHRYVLQVSDSGRGMSDEERAKLFQPFKSFFDGGTGIGMAIVYRIVHEHGGRLAVDSQPGGGTTITVELPAAESAPASLEEMEARR